MIDIHCHLLPGIDDGPPTLEAALQLAQALVEDGVRHVVCTPHVFPGRFENRRSSIEQAYEDFRAVLHDTGIDLQLSFAGEVRLTPEVLVLLQRGELPFLGEYRGARTMLLEFPDGQLPVGAERFVDKLLEQRIRPVIVHPERNRAVIDDPKRMAGFMEMGSFLQLTASSVTGHFGERVQKTAQALLDKGWVHAVASDAHNLGGRKPRMSAAAAWLRQHYGVQAARQLVELGPALLSHKPPISMLPTGSTNGSP